ncbi:MAG: HAD family hydrolase [Solobacterium sp.]|nr:HAD family hydrolase [Solobacterium sp.]MDO4192262.1 HAD family hydrolase [Erysipelotrichaceae bacterium]
MIKNIKVFAADIDGTLVNKGKEMHPGTRDALIRLHREGVRIGVASGRPLDHRTLEKNKEWDLPFEFDYAIGMNGGDLYDRETGEYEHFFLLEPDTIREILSFIAPLDVNAIVYENGYDLVRALRMDDFMRSSIARNHSIVEIGGIDELSRRPTGKIEVHYKPENAEEVLSVVDAHPSEKWIAVRTFTGTVEFLDPRINKGMALEKYAQRYNIPMSETIAFGDMENDIQLLQYAGWGVCLKNGSDDTKAAADDITEYPVEEDGIGRYLQKHWFHD